MYGLIVIKVIIMRITTSKSKNSESYYITKSYTNAQGKSTSKTIRELGTLAELSERLGTDRDGVMIPFRSNKLMDYNRQNFLPEAISSSSLFTMVLRWIPHTEKSKAAISLSMS